MPGALAFLQIRRGEADQHCAGVGELLDVGVSELLGAGVVRELLGAGVSELLGCIQVIGNILELEEAVGPTWIGSGCSTLR